MIIFADNWNTEAGLRAKHGTKYNDDWNSLAYFGWQQVCTMLNTWAKRELLNNNVVYLKKLAEHILDSTKTVTVVLGPHQPQNFDGVWYFHLTVQDAKGRSYHFFNKVAERYAGDNYRLEACFCGASPSATIYEERYRFTA
jgi:hypothetical protein